VTLCRRANRGLSSGGGGRGCGNTNARRATGLEKNLVELDKLERCATAVHRRRNNEDGRLNVRSGGRSFLSIINGRREKYRLVEFGFEWMNEDTSW